MWPVASELIACVREWGWTGMAFPLLWALLWAMGVCWDSDQASTQLATPSPCGCCAATTLTLLQLCTALEVSTSESPTILTAWCLELSLWELVPHASAGEESRS